MIKNACIGGALALLLAGCEKGSQSNDSVSTGAPAEVKLSDNRNLYSSGNGVEAAGSSSSSFGREPRGSMEPAQHKTSNGFEPLFPDTPGATMSGTGGVIPPAIAGSHGNSSIEQGSVQAAPTFNRIFTEETLRREEQQAQAKAPGLGEGVKQDGSPGNGPAETANKQGRQDGAGKTEQSKTPQ
jgi:hypothetical protein